MIIGVRKISFVLIFVLLLALLSCIFLLIRNKIEKEELELSEKYLTDDNLMLKNRLTYYVQGYSQQLFVEGTTPNQGLFADFFVVKNQPILVLRFSDSNCNDCVTDMFNEIRSFFSEDFVSANIVVLITSGSANSDVLIRKKYGFGGKIFYLKNGLASSMFESLNVPYLFVLNKGNMTMPFIYDSNMKSLLHIYFRDIQAMFDEK
ncbi:MAG TPA: hypothetical protein VNQ80_03675 [Parapedobacter sp.]|uniref:hypothetical protein n=1 Tax=Parapedobacter sp. TaxID=1958893 RepID=UPI002C938663|nr:hypothetical protein [Parapedobacter sp.]HWK56408.1 hypothetical protein [Parapedobacter sp.]